jgi:hypothetical protein
VNRDRNLDELIGADTAGAERERLQRAHEMLLEAGPPPELSPKLEAGPTFGMTLARRRAVTRRAMLLLAATLAVLGVFLAGYAVANRGGSSPSAPKSLALEGTVLAPNAQATLEVWQSHAGNWPMTLTAVGLPPLPAHRYYEVYLVRHGKPWGACGAFRVLGNPQQPVTVTLTAPYTLRKGDSWIVTRPGAGGAEPGQTVLQPAPVTA